jgi:hypothetical protein
LSTALPVAGVVANFDNVAFFSVGLFRPALTSKTVFPQDVPVAF